MEKELLWQRRGQDTATISKKWADLLVENPQWRFDQNRRYFDFVRAEREKIQFQERELYYHKIQELPFLLFLPPTAAPSWQEYLIAKRQQLKLWQQLRQHVDLAMTEFRANKKIAAKQLSILGFLYLHEQFQDQVLVQAFQQDSEILSQRSSC